MGLVPSRSIAPWAGMGYVIVPSKVYSPIPIYHKKSTIHVGVFLNAHRKNIQSTYINILTYYIAYLCPIGSMCGTYIYTTFG